MNGKNKVLMLSPDINGQGGIASVVKMYKTNDLYKDNIIYMPTYSGGNIFNKLVVYSVFLIKFLFMMVFNKSIEIIHIHTASRGSFLRKSIAFFISKIFNKKVILHIHGAEFDIFYDNLPSFFKIIVRKVLKNADLVIVLANKWAENIKKIESASNIKILHNPVEINKQNSLNGVNVLFMGRLGKRKGVFDIIEAAKLMKSSAIINLYGDGDIKFENLPENIHICGWVAGAEKQQIFENSDILILPSYSEGLPISILEAMSFGMPVVATDVGGISEAVFDNVNGFLIKCGDYKTLAEKIDLLSDFELRKKMGNESYRLAIEMFDINIINKKLEEIYDNLSK